MGDELNDVKNWPNVVFKFILSLLGSTIIIMGTALYNKVDKATEALITIANRLDSTIKDFDYLRKDFTRLDARLTEEEKRGDNLEKENAQLRAMMSRYHDK